MFLIRKVISQFVYPLPFVFVLLFTMIALFYAKKKSASRAVGAVLLFVVVALSFDPVPYIFASRHEQRYAPLFDTVSDVSAVVVLGGGSCSDPSLPVSSQLMEASLIRLVEGIAQWRRYDSIPLIVTGGAVLDTATIASLQRRMAMQLGVDSSRILMADSALDTESEAVAVKKMIAGNRVVLVTSALHMHRASLLFKKAGLEPIPAPTNHKARKGPFSPTDLFPDSNNWRTWKSTVHEYFGLFWSKVRGRI